jgi:hypothetical protein
LPWDKIRWPVTIILLATLGSFVWLIDRGRSVDQLQWLIAAGIQLLNLVITIHVGRMASRAEASAGKAQDAAEATQDKLNNGAVADAVRSVMNKP